MVRSIPLSPGDREEEGCSTEGHVEEAASGNGEELFKQHCGQCHTLADAGTQGRIGPNLDEAFAYVRSDRPGQGFEESTLRDVVRVPITDVTDPAPYWLVSTRHPNELAAAINGSRRPRVEGEPA